jgi:hypothetical protein
LKFITVDINTNSLNWFEIPEGGKILMQKKQIAPEVGYMAFFLDTEGNRIALHTQN